MRIEASVERGVLRPDREWWIGFWILDSMPWIPDSWYWIPVFVSGTWNLDSNRFRISDSLSCIPDSKTQNSTVPQT